MVESDEVRAEFSTRGAVLLSWTLKRYPGAHGHALDLLPVATDVNALPAFSLTTTDETVSNTLASANFTPSAQTLDLRGTGGRTLRFDYEDASGLRATKLFTFERDRQAFLRRLLGPGAAQRAAAELHDPLGSGHRRHRARPAIGRHDVRQLLPGARRHHVRRRDQPYRHRQACRAARLRRRRSATRAWTTTTSSARPSSTGRRASSTRRTRCRPLPVRARSCRTP